jgi:hypothetical protein
LPPHSHTIASHRSQCAHQGHTPVLQRRVAPQICRSASTRSCTQPRLAHSRAADSTPVASTAWRTCVTRRAAPSCPSASVVLQTARCSIRQLRVCPGASCADRFRSQLMSHRARINKFLCSAKC